MFIFNQTNADIGTIMWLCSRLAIIGAGVYVGSKMLMEAFLLSWVKRFLEMHEASIGKENINSEDSVNNDSEIST